LVPSVVFFLQLVSCTVWITRQSAFVIKTCGCLLLRTSSFRSRSLRWRVMRPPTFITVVLRSIIICVVIRPYSINHKKYGYSIKNVMSDRESGNTKRSKIRTTHARVNKKDMYYLISLFTCNQCSSNDTIVRSNSCSSLLELNTSFLVRSSAFLLIYFLLLVKCGKMKENEEEEYPPEDD